MLRKTLIKCFPRENRGHEVPFLCDSQLCTPNHYEIKDFCGSGVRSLRSISSLFQVRLDVLAPGCVYWFKSQGLFSSVSLPVAYLLHETATSLRFRHLRPTTENQPQMQVLSPKMQMTVSLYITFDRYYLLNLLIQLIL